MEPTLILIFLLVALNGVTLVLLWRALARSDRDTRLEAAVREEFRLNREETQRTARDDREELRQALQGSEARLDRMRGVIQDRLEAIQRGNENKLEQMRHTVDEKLQGTLEKRLGESFRIVADRLEAVQRGLGEMQELAAGVGDLKRVLSNVKVRGTWGEVQLGSLLEQVLAPGQYAANVEIRPHSGEVVEFAIRLPGPEEDDSEAVWLPIDAKFPQEDYLRIVEASERADAEAVKAARIALLRSIQSAAKEISTKYVRPPHSTDFAIMFLPTEGLYAEVLREPGTVETLQRRFRVVVAGPTTLSAILNSLQMGFRTLALERRSGEVWKILGAVKAEFGTFAQWLDKVKRQLAAATNTIDQTGRRTRAMERRLREVEQLPIDDARDVLELESRGNEPRAEAPEAAPRAGSESNPRGVLF